MGTDPAYKSNHGAAVAIKRAREIVPGVRIWAGVGLTGCTTQIAHGNVKQIEDTLADLHGWCLDQRIESVCWDSEEAGKLYPQAGEDTARMALGIFRVVANGIVQTFTSYGVPVRIKVRGSYTGGHAPFRFRPWVGSDGADAVIPQKYCAPGSGMAKPGALAYAIEASSLAHKKLEQLGIARPGLVDWDYYQFHHTPADQLIECGAKAHIVCAWASKNIDSDGETALIALARLKAHGFVGETAILDFQRAHALLVDGEVGSETLEALGIDKIPEP